MFIKSIELQRTLLCPHSPARISKHKQTNKQTEHTFRCLFKRNKLLNLDDIELLLLHSLNKLAVRCLRHECD